MADLQWLLENYAPRAWTVLEKCLWRVSWGKGNPFYLWVESLDGVDTWHTYITNPKFVNFTAAERSQFFQDSALSRRPGIYVNVLDIDKNSYYLDIDKNWIAKKDANWNNIYRYHWTNEVVDWNKIAYKKNKDKKFLFFTTRKKRMMVAPIWYTTIKLSMLNYVDHIRKFDLMSEEWYDILQNDIKNFFTKIERWDQSVKEWYHTIYKLYNSWLGNHFYLMARIMPSFKRVMSDRNYANMIFWKNFTNDEFSEFSAAAAAYANTSRAGNITVVDTLNKEYKDKLYWVNWTLLYKENKDTWEMYYAPHKWKLTKDYFMKLNTERQIEQIQYTLWDWAPSINKVWKRFTIDLWYNSWWRILNFISVIWKPSVFAALMSIWEWFTWFLPLLILNSWMFVTDAISRWHRLDGNWKSFLNKWWLQDWLPNNVQWFSWWLWATLWDIAVTATWKAKQAWEQWLFNIWDLLMENSYRIRQYQAFFEAQFPWIKDINELDRIISDMYQSNPERVEKLIDAARSYTDYSVRLSTTNAPYTAALLRIHPTKHAVNQSFADTFWTLWHFFSWWGLNKVMWWLEIAQAWVTNIYRWKIWAKYLDDLLSAKLSPAEVNAAMTKAYLENEDFLYMMTKIHTALLIGKYLDRLSEDWDDKRWETIFTDFKDMLSYLEIFSWEIAWLTATPEWRMVSTFIDVFSWEIANQQNILKSWEAASFATIKEAVRSLFRKLYALQMATEYASLVTTSEDWEDFESNWLRWIFKSVSDNANGYLFYLKDKTENWWYDYYIPKWPNAYLRDILWKSDANIQFINDQKNYQKYANLFNWEDTFLNWILYSFPFFKQWKISQIDEVEDFIDDHFKFRWTQAYIDMTNGKLPSDMTDSDWEYLYNATIGRLINNTEHLDLVTLKWDYSFTDKEWNVRYKQWRQAQEDLIHLLMKEWLSEEKATEFAEMMKNIDDDHANYQAEAIRTLAYIEAKTPGSSLQALAYVMNQAWFEYTYMSWTKYEWDALKERSLQWRIYAAKKYGQYVPDADKYYTWPQFILYYAKTHNTPLAKYIDGPGENNQWQMKLITPDTQYANKMLRQNFQAQLMVDIEWASGNPNARKLMNWLALIFDTKPYEDKDWNVNPAYAAYALNQIETIYNHVDSWPDDAQSKRIVNQWVLMFWDKLLPFIVQDEKLMEREDVRTMVNDWTSYWYKELKDIDDIAKEEAEDYIANKRRWKGWWYNNLLNWWYSKKFPWFLNWYNYLKNRAYSPYYTKYKVFDWTPREYQKNYLSERDFEQAKRAQAQFMYHWENPNVSKKSKWGKSQDDTIGVTSRRWKAFQFYKMEDPNKAVEYRLPWRKRWVRKWSWTKPIAPTTWKHLTPTPKR